MSYIVSPNMNLQIPVVGVEPGPNYATDINNSLTVIDAHDHTVGNGVQITPSAININANLSLNSNSLTLVKSIDLSPIASNVSTTSIYSISNDLYFNDGAGNVIRMTQSGSVTGASGTITGLPSGTASAAYSTGLFTFQAATATAANIDGGSYVYRNNVANSKGVTVSPKNSLAVDYSLFLPLIPAQKNLVTLDTSGNLVADTNVDGSTIQLVSNVISVAPSGITATQIANATITGSKIAAATITGSNIAATTIAASNIVAGTITGTQITSDVNLPGGSVKAGSANVVVSSINAATGLAVIRAGFAASGTLTVGEGAFAVNTSPGGGILGEYLVTYSNAFADIAIPTVTVVDSGGGAWFATLVSVSSSNFVVRLWQSGVGSFPSDFVIQVMGRRF